MGCLDDRPERRVSLFVCDECETIENTATSRYWTRGMAHTGLNGRALC